MPSLSISSAALPGPLPFIWRQVKADGASARVLELGAGPPIVVVASPLILARTYVPLARVLAAHARVSVVELPGSGGASRTRTPWSFAEQGAFLRKLLATMEIERATVVGHSNGGPPVAFASTSPHPAIARIVLADTVGSAPRGLARVLVARAVDAFRELRLDPIALPHVARNAFSHTRAFLHQVRASASVDLAEPARDLCVPTLLAWGRHDGTMPLDGAARLAALLPRAKLHVGPGSHDWLVTHPDAFAKAVLRFAAET